jgi:hypothetical protein
MVVLLVVRTTDYVLRPNIDLVIEGFARAKARAHPYI